MLNYTLEPYERLYASEAADTLWDELHDTHAHAAGSSSAPQTTLAPELAPLPPDGAERCSEREAALLGCIVAIYQAIPSTVEKPSSRAMTSQSNPVAFGTPGWSSGSRRRQSTAVRSPDSGGNRHHRTQSTRPRHPSTVSSWGPIAAPLP